MKKSMRAVATLIAAASATAAARGSKSCVMMRASRNGCGGITARVQTAPQPRSPVLPDTECREPAASVETQRNQSPPECSLCRS